MSPEKVNTNETTEERELRELEKLASEARGRMQARADSSQREIKMRKLREEIKLGELDEQLGVRGRDYVPIFDPKTGAMVVLRTPSEVSMQAYQQVALDPSTTGMKQVEAANNLINSSLAYPSKAEFGKLCGTTPGFIDSALTVCSRLSNVETADIMGKA